MRDIEERKHHRESEQERRLATETQAASKRRRARNREYTFVSCFFVLIFVSTDRVSDLF